MLRVIRCRVVRARLVAHRLTLITLNSAPRDSSSLLHPKTQSRSRCMRSLLPLRSLDWRETPSSPWAMIITLPQLRLLKTLRSSSTCKTSSSWNRSMTVSIRLCQSLVARETFSGNRPPSYFPVLTLLFRTNPASEIRQPMIILKTTSRTLEGQL